jgi:Fe-S cluster assembly scaffold protein SufB
MQQYGLKISSIYEKPEQKTIDNARGYYFISESGNYVFNCIADTIVEHDIKNTLIHVTCNSKVDAIKIEIRTNGKVSDGEVSDVYHKIVAKNVDVTMCIDAKGVAGENSKIIYRSSLGADENATGNGIQKGEFIILANSAEVDAVPGLDIYSDTVPTTHNISIGGIDKNKIWYMTSRGMSESDAREQYVSGFLGRLENVK